MHLTNKRRSPGELSSFADQRRGLQFLGSSADGDILGRRVLEGKEGQDSKSFKESRGCLAPFSDEETEAQGVG